MTIAELMNMPVGMKFEEWEKELKRRKAINRKIRKYSDEIYEEVDSLEALRNEVGSERWMKHNNRLFNLIEKRDKLLKELEGRE